MGSWESQIRHKVLQARPFESQANWERMSGLLAETPVTPMKRKRKALLYWQIAAGLALLAMGSIGLYSGWSNVQSHAVEHPMVMEQRPGETHERSHDCEGELPLESLASALASPTSPTVYATTSTPSTTPAYDTRTSTLSSLNPIQVAFPVPRLPHAIPPPPSIREAHFHGLAPMGIAMMPRSLGPKIHQRPLDLHIPRPAKGNPIFAARKPEDIPDWKLGFYLNTEHSQRRVDMGDGSSFHYLFVNSGVGFGMMRRVKDIWEAGIRLDFSEVFLPAKTTQEGYADLLGTASHGRLLVRRYFRKHPEKIFQPYASLSAGVNFVELDYLQITPPANTPNPDIPAPNSRTSGGWNIPGSIENKIAALSQDPAYTVQRFIDYNRYLQMTQGVDIGAEFRVLPRWSVNLESGFNTRIQLNQVENAELEVAEPAFFLNHRLGLQWAF